MYNLKLVDIRYIIIGILCEISLCGLYDKEIINNITLTNKKKIKRHLLCTILVLNISRINYEI